MARTFDLAPMSGRPVAMTRPTKKSELGDLLRSLGGADVARGKLTALDAYLEKVTHCMAWQLAEAVAELPAHFVIPPLADAFQQQAVIDCIHSHLSDRLDASYPLTKIRVMIDDGEDCGSMH